MYTVQDLEELECSKWNIEYESRTIADVTKGVYKINICIFPGSTPIICEEKSHKKGSARYYVDKKGYTCNRSEYVMEVMHVDRAIYFILNKEIHKSMFLSTLVDLMFKILKKL